MQHKKNKQISGTTSKDITKKQRAEFALKFIGTKKKILDVGCNIGSISKIFRSKDNYVVGIDFSHEHIKIAEKNCNEAYYHDIRNGIPFPKNTFDVVFAGEFIEHLSEMDGIKFLKECRKILKRNGSQCTYRKEEKSECLLKGNVQSSK